MIQKGTMISLEGMLITFLIITVALLSGCSSPNWNSNQNVLISYLVIITLDGDILQTAYEDYDVLRNKYNKKYN